MNRFACIIERTHCVCARACVCGGGGGGEGENSLNMHETTVVAKEIQPTCQKQRQGSCGPCGPRISFCEHACCNQARRNDFGGGAAMEGGSRGPPPGKKFQKLKPIASISGHLVPFQCTVTTMKDFLILQKTKKMLRSGTNITLPREKNSKIEANCKHSQAFGAISVYMDF